MAGRIRLGSASESPLRLRQLASKLAQSRSLRDLRRVVLSRVRLQGLPLRVRPAFIVLTLLSLLILAALGFHPTLAKKITVDAVPFWDKILHFWCFGFAAAEFYAIWSVEDTAREWYWRYFAELASLVVCAGCGGVGSEFVQGLLPYKTFQWGDVIANLLGTALGVYIARTATRAHHRAQELRQLYQPVNLAAIDELSDDDSDYDGANEREMEEGRAAAAAGNRGYGPSPTPVRADRMFDEGPGGGRKKARIEANVWDESDEVFGLGSDDDEGEPHRGFKDRAV